jgi:hypothetical protein
MQSKPKKHRSGWDIKAVINRDLSSATDILSSATAIADYSALRAQWTGDIDNVYRVAIDGISVEVMCLGMDVDVSVEGIYNSTSELPMWMQERLAVLSMMKVNPPQTKIEGIGMRVDERVYWVLRGE